jgi:hypothetical protein
MTRERKSGRAEERKTGKAAERPRLQLKPSLSLPAFISASNCLPDSALPIRITLIPAGAVLKGDNQRPPRTVYQQGLRVVLRTTADRLEPLKSRFQGTGRCHVAARPSTALEGPSGEVQRNVPRDLFGAPVPVEPMTSEEAWNSRPLGILRKSWSRNRDRPATP